MSKAAQSTQVLQCDISHFEKASGNGGCKLNETGCSVSRDPQHADGSIAKNKNGGSGTISAHAVAALATLMDSFLT